MIPPKDLAAAMRTLHALAEQAGRTPRDLPVSIFGVPGEEATLRQYQEVGVERAVFTYLVQVQGGLLAEAAGARLSDYFRAKRLR